MSAASKKDVLLTTWEGGGNVPPVLAVASKLIAAGHRVRIMSEACNRPECEATGAEFVPWTTAPSRADKAAESTYLRDFDCHAMDGFREVIHGIMFGPAAAHAADVLAAITARRPNIIVTSDMLFGVMAAAEASQLPFVLLCPNVSLVPLDGVPPLGPGLEPARDEAERQQHAAIADEIRALYNEGLPAFNATREQLGLRPLAHVLDQTEKAAFILLGTARAFDFAPDQLPARHVYIGPQFHDQRSDERWALPFPPGDDRPLVVVSFSTTFQNQGAALRTVLSAIAALPVRALVTLGPSLDAADFAVPANAIAMRHAPHGRAMAAADVVITHGGHGTVMRALSNDCPMLVMPMGRDQNDNAARVVARGAGLSLDPATASTEAVQDAIRRLIEERSFKGAAAHLGGQIRAEAAASPVVALIEQAGRDFPAWEEAAA